ncbi:hypothetical protein LJB92_00005, partial [Bacteroidales bacterium OttesenSCG-928-M06]|nr:hypothetical protein [Bacteroidales bacterium OttesenSCG-928-M06]
MNKRFWVPFLFLFSGIISSYGQDIVFKTIKTELNRNFDVLKQQDIPAYYGFVRLDEVQAVSAVANLGKLQSEAIINSPNRILSSGLRIGDNKLDNSHEIRESGWGSSPGLSVSATYIPYEENTRLLKNNIWLLLDDLYKNGVQTYEQVKANIAVKVEQEDKSPDFSIEKVRSYYEDPIAWEDLNIDPKALEDKVRKYSAIFDQNDDIRDGVAYLAATLSRNIFIDTEGREMAQNAISIQLMLSANVLANDGMFLPLNKSWTAFSLKELPSDEEVLKVAKEMSTMLSALKKAPVVEAF